MSYFAKKKIYLYLQKKKNIKKKRVNIIMDTFASLALSTEPPNEYLL